MGILEDLLASHLDREAFSTGLASGVASAWQTDETKRAALVHDYLCRPDDYRAQGIDLDGWEPVIRRREALSDVRERLTEAGWIPDEQRLLEPERDGRSATCERLRKAGWI